MRHLLIPKEMTRGENSRIQNYSHMVTSFLEVRATNSYSKTDCAKLEHYAQISTVLLICANYIGNLLYSNHVIHIVPEEVMVHNNHIMGKDLDVIRF